MNVKILALFSCVILSGCMPEFRREIQTPHVFGVVYDDKTHKPIKEAFVAFVDSEEKETEYKDQSLRKVSASTSPDGSYSINPTKWTYYLWLVGPCGLDLPSQDNTFRYLKFSAVGYKPEYLYLHEEESITRTKSDTLPDYYNLKIRDVFLRK